MKGRFSGRKATQMFMHLPHFSRCERMQHKIPIHRLGSSVAFAAQTTSDRFRKQRRSLRGARTGAMRTWTKPLPRHWHLWLMSWVALNAAHFEI
jgi:hypothetical protein